MLKKNRLKKRPGLTLDSASVQDNVPTEIISGVYIGSVHCAFNKESLAEYGITHILNISGVPATYPRNFTYLQVTMRDKDYANLLSAIPAANIFIESALDGNGKILVHCKGGRSRSAAFISAFIMSTQRISFEKAFQMVKKKRPIVSVNKGFEQQLIAYGNAKWNVYGAHQILLKEHFNNLLEEYESNGQVIVRQLASCALSTPVRLRLTRPQSASVQIIPPLRGSDMQFVCRQCKTPLFVTSSIVVPNNNNFDEKRESPRRKSSTDIGETTNPRPPRLRRHYASDTIASFSSEEMEKFKLNAISNNSSNDDMETLSPSKMKRTVASEPRMKSKMLNNNMSFESNNMMPPPSPMSRRQRNNSNQNNGFGDTGDEHDTNVNSSKLKKLNTSSSKYSEDEKGTTSNCNENSDIIDEGKNTTDNDMEQKIQMKEDNYETQYTYPPSTPPLRPKSKEKQRWLSRMKALECGTLRPNNRQHRPSLIARNDETRAVDVCARKHFFIEPMEWMGKIDNTNGPLSCANEMCKLQLGHYDWRGLSATSETDKGATLSNISSSKTSDGYDDDEDDELFIVPAFRIEAGLVIAQESL